MKFVLAALLVLALVFIYSLHLNQYLSFEALRDYHITLQTFTQEHFIEASLAVLLAYIIVAGLSIPGAVFVTITGGYLFGIAWGTIISVIGATVGACIVYASVRYLFHDWLAARTGPWLTEFKKGISQDLFHYLFVIRLIPLFPFWVVNIIPPLLGMRFRQFAIATFCGIIPDIMIFSAVGNSLSTVFEANTTPSLDIIYQPQIYIPLTLLILLALSPIVYHRVISKKS